jgi:hypothetical protein
MMVNRWPSEKADARLPQPSQRSENDTATVLLEGARLVDSAGRSARSVATGSSMAWTGLDCREQWTRQIKSQVLYH